MKYALSLFAAAAVLLTTGSVTTLYAQHNHGAQPNPQMEDECTMKAACQDNVLKVGKKGEITLDTQTQVGDLLLNPGRYTLQHRVDGADHVLLFVAQSRKNASGEVRCTLEPLQHKASQTQMRLQNAGALPRLVQIQIAGENVAHVL